MAKKDNEQKREFAFMLYMSGESQKSISERVGVSVVTVNNWVDKHGWKARRAAANITRTELVNKMLGAINTLIEQVTESGEPSAIDGLGDKLVKFAATIERLEGKTNIITELETFTSFSKWLIVRMQVDKELTPEIVKRINKYQDLFINERLGV